MQIERPTALLEKEIPMSDDANLNPVELATELTIACMGFSGPL